MKHQTLILSWLACGLLALGAGCGKNDNPAPAGNPEKPAKPETMAPAKAEKPVAPAASPVTNAAAAVVTAPEPTTKPVATAVPKAAEPPATPTTAATVANDSPIVPTPTPATTPTPAPTSAPSLLTQASQAAAGLTGLSQDQMVQGLREALGKGLQQAVAGLGRDGGFLTNLNVKIPMPDKLQKVETALRAVKQDKLADDFVATMNHAAEQAVPQAGAVFADALKQMSIADAQSILTGPNDAATQYFQKTTQTNLYAKFYPIVQQATQKTGVTSAYKNLMDKANVTQGLGNLGSLGSLGSTLGGSLLDKDSLDLDAYVTNKALDGLFKMVAAEETQIRQNPVARSTALLQQVFGAVKK